MKNFISLMTVLVAVPAFAELGPKTMTYEGRILDSANQPLSGAQTLVLKITNSAGNCAVYQETLTPTLSAEGFFAVALGNNTNEVAGGVTLAQALANKGTIPGQPSCSIPASDYNGRKLQVTVNSVLMGSIDLGSVPYAMAADTLQGLAPSDFVKTNAFVTQAKMDTLAGTSNWDKLMKLIAAPTTLNNSIKWNGTDWVAYSPVAAADIPSCTGGNVLTYSSSTFSCVPSGGGVGDATTSAKGAVQIGTGIAVSAGTISADFGTTAGKVAQGDDSRFTDKLPLAGGTLTGALTLSGDPSVALHAATKQYVDNTGGMYIKKDGTVAFTGAASMGSNKITNVADPTAAQDAATKNYVDSAANGKQEALASIAGNVGVGTSAPAAKLDINGTIKISGGTPGAGKFLQSDANGLASWETITAGGDFMKDGTQAITGPLHLGGNTLYGHSVANGSLTLKPTSSATPGYVLLAPTGGDVGIGLSVPYSMLHLHQHSSGFTRAAYTSTNSGSSSGDGFQVGVNNSDLTAELWNNELASIIFGTNNVQRMVIDSSGKVGIGTHTPEAKLHVDGGLKIGFQSSCSVPERGTLRNNNGVIEICSNSDTWVGVGGPKMDEFWKQGGAVNVPTDTSQWSMGQQVEVGSFTFPVKVDDLFNVSVSCKAYNPTAGDVSVELDSHISAGVVNVVESTSSGSDMGGCSFYSSSPPSMYLSTGSSKHYTGQAPYTGGVCRGVNNGNITLKIFAKAANYADSTVVAPAVENCVITVNFKHR